MPRHCAHPVARRFQRRTQPATDEPGRTRDEDLHRASFSRSGRGRDRSAPRRSDDTLRDPRPRVERERAIRVTEQLAAGTAQRLAPSLVKRAVMRPGRSDAEREGSHETVKPW
jgi:hypothetical protein